MSTLQDRLAGLPEAPEPTTELAAISAIQQIVPAEFFKAGGSEDILTKLETEVRAWERRRTESGAQIRWMFSTD